MPQNGILGKGVTVANTTLNIYTVPGDLLNYAVANIRCINTTDETAEMTIYISTSNTPAIGDLYEYKALIPPNGGVLDDQAVVLSRNEKVFVMSNKAGVVVSIRGLEKYPTSSS